MTKQEEAIQELLDVLQDQDILYTIARHTSRTGTHKYISVFWVEPEDNEICCLDELVADALKEKTSDKYEGSIKMRGGGVDVGHALVYSLSECLGIKLEQRWL